MRIRIAADIELERLVEYVFVAVGRRIEQADRLPGANLLAAHDSILSRGARELDDRRGPARDLFHSRLHHPRISLEPLELVRILDHREQTAGGRMAGGLI